VGGRDGGLPPSGLSALLVSQDAQCFEPFPQTAAEGGEGCLTGDVLRLDQRTARAQKRWRRINAPQMVQKVIERIKFENGLEVKIEKKKREKAAA
jgi:hypothetical protein